MISNKEIREVERYPETPNLSEKLISLLTKLCFCVDKPNKTDLIFVFGTYSMQKHVVDIIEKLITEKHSKTLIITGGIADYQENPYTAIAESEAIYSLISPSKLGGIDVYLEKKSRNTLENVVFASKIVDFKAYKSIMCLSHIHASRRSIQTLRKIFFGEIYSIPYYSPSNNPEVFINETNWWLSKEGRSMVWGEYLRFKTYGSRGDFPITPEITMLLEQISKYLQ